MEPEHKYISTENIQSMLDENSTLIVEIIQLNNSVKHERGAQLADVQDKLDKKRKKLNRNLMTLAKWADESTEPPVKSAPRPPVVQQAPSAHIPPQYQPVPSSGGVTVPLNVPEPIVVAPQSTSPPTAAADAVGPTSPVKHEVKDDPMGTEEDAANNDTGAPSSTSAPAKPESEDQVMEDVAEVDPSKEVLAEGVAAQDSSAAAQDQDQAVETPAPTDDDTPVAAPTDSAAKEGTDEAAVDAPVDDEAAVDVPAATTTSPATPDAGDDAQEVTAPATVEEEAIADEKSIAEEEDEAAASPAGAVDEPSTEPAAEVATAAAASESGQVGAEPDAVATSTTEEGAKDAATDDQPEQVEESKDNE